MSINWFTKSQGPGKNVFVFRGGGSTLTPPTPPVVRLVLLHTEPVVQDLCPGTVHMSIIFDTFLKFYRR